MNYTIVDGKVIYNALYNKDTKSGNYRECFIKGFTFKLKNKVTLTTINNIVRNVNWDIKELEKYIEYVNITENSEFQNTYSLYYIEGGVINGKKIIYSATVITDGKNIGKKNETNVFTQMISQCNSEYNKKIDKGYFLQKELTNFQKNDNNKLLAESNSTEPMSAELNSIENKVNDKLLAENNVENCKFYPMALHKWEESKDKIKFPAYVQPKLDGVRVLIQIDQSKLDKYPNVSKLSNVELDEIVLIYSRKLKPYLGFHDIKKQALNIILHYLFNYKLNVKCDLVSPNKSSDEMLVLDGEFYNPNINFEKLIGYVRNENDKDIKDIQFYMFDSFIYNIIDKICYIKKESFESRLQRNINLFKNINYNVFNLFKSDFISDFKFVETKLVNNEDEILVSLDNYIKDKYEGIIIRSKNGLYESSTNREIRSYQALKLKKFIDAEYPIKGITDGNKGKEIGAIKYILGLPDGNVFNATPNMTLIKRRELFVKYSNKKEFEKIKDKMVTVRYQELTDNGVPRFAKVIAVRDYE